MNRPPRKRRKRYDDNSYWTVTPANFTCPKCGEPVMIAHHRFMTDRKGAWCQCARWPLQLSAVC